MMQPTRQSLIALLLFSGLVCEFAVAAPPVTDLDVQHLVQYLGHDQYHRRLSAKTKLIQLVGEGQFEDPTNDLVSNLVNGLQNPSLEVRSSVADILLMIRQRDFALNLDRLSNPNYPIDQFSSVGWQQFSKVAGTDQQARWAFAAICRQHPSALASMRSVKEKQSEFTNPFQLSADDHVGWMILLMPAIPKAEPGVDDRFRELDSNEATQISRIATSLGQTSLGLQLHADTDRQNWLEPIFSRVVTAWVNRNRSIIDPSTAMRVAVRYHCDRTAIKIAKQTLNERSSSAPAIVTAMLTLSKLDHQESIQDRQNTLKAFCSDERTVHVWQAIADRRIQIQTEVRDIAIATMLDQASQDPRQFGFIYLEADPLLTFRDYSLGFENNQLRRASHQSALKFLATGE